MPAQQTLEMQCLGLADFKVLIDQNAFQPPGTPASSASHTTALLLIFHTDVDLKDIGCVNIGAPPGVVTSTNRMPSVDTWGL